jgi:hypothetical protein
MSRVDRGRSGGNPNAGSIGKRPPATSATPKVAIRRGPQTRSRTAEREPQPDAASGQQQPRDEERYGLDPTESTTRESARWMVREREPLTHNPLEGRRCQEQQAACDPSDEQATRPSVSHRAGGRRCWS